MHARMVGQRPPKPRPRPAQGKLPEDLAALHSAGICSIAAVTVGPPGEPLGMLLLGKRAPGGFNAKW
jgi:hypothetical protein